MSTVAALGAIAGAGAAGACTESRPANTAVYASGTDLESGNPLVTVHALSRQVQRYALFVTLAQYDSTLAPVPYFARSWTWSPDRRSLTFALVSDLRWDDGLPTTSRDVAFTIDAARDPATGYYRAADLAPIARVETPNDTTVRVDFSAAQPGFPLVLCELPIVPEHLLGRVAHGEMRHAAFNLHPVGNGPFTFVDRRAGSSWTFARNAAFPHSLGGPPTLSGFVVTVVDEPTTKFAGLASGELDIAGIAPDMASLAARDRSLRVVSYPVLVSTGLVFNVHRPPFDDVRVRRAVSLSIDRDRIVQAALAGYGVPASGPVPAENPLALASAPRHDPAEADSLLDAGGWRRGRDGLRRRGGRVLAFDLTTVGSGDNALEQLVQADLAARGMRVGIRQVELGTFLGEARAATKTFDVLVAGIPGDLDLAYLAAMFDSRQAGGLLDYAGYHTPALDSLFAATRRAATDTARVAAWRSVQRELARQVPVAWIYQSRGVQGVAARLHHVTMDLRGEMVSLRRWSFAAPAPMRTATR